METRLGYTKVGGVDSLRHFGHEIIIELYKLKAIEALQLLKLWINLSLEKLMNEKKTITEEDVNSIIESEEYQKLGRKTTACVLTLKNGFEIVATSACVDPDNYNEEIGRETSKKRAIDKIWELEGYHLQCFLNAPYGGAAECK